MFLFLAARKLRGAVWKRNSVLHCLYFVPPSKKLHYTYEEDYYYTQTQTHFIFNGKDSNIFPSGNCCKNALQGALSPAFNYISYYFLVYTTPYIYFSCYSEIVDVFFDYE